MRTLRQALVGSFVLVLALSAAALAQERHAVDPAALANSVTQHVAEQEARRAVVHEALARPEVREMAGRAGIDLDRVDRSVDTLTGESLDRMASAAGDVNQALAGGASTVVISTTTIIIALLVIIIIILAV
jgi:predicted outer membrane protein